MSNILRNPRQWLAVLLLALATLALPGSASAQYHRHDDFYNGARQGGRGGYYNGRGHGYDDRYHGSGIGPGKGAAIGGVGGAVLGLAFGGGAKGALIGGAAGAGIGAIAGQANQNHRRNDYYRGR